MWDYTKERPSSKPLDKEYIITPLEVENERGYGTSKIIKFSIWDVEDP